MLIYHITSSADWQQAQEQGQYTAPSLDKEGFIHASTREQVAETACRYYQGVTGLVLLVIDTTLLRPELHFDPVDLPSGPTRFPHLYGPLNLSAVTAVLPFEPQPDGSFVFPA